MKRPPDRRGPDDGFSLVEVIAAFGVFAIVAVAVAGLLFQTVQLSRTNRQRIVAANLMTQQSALVRQIDAATATIGTSTRTTVIDKVSYTVTTVLSWVDSGTITGSCDGSAGQPSTRAFLRATYTTTWPNMKLRPPAQTTLVPVSAGSTAPTISALAVKALDRNSAGEASVPVTVTSTAGGAGTTISTDISGCAYFPSLPEGTYRISATAAGKVDDTNQNKVTSVVTVAAGRLPTAYVFYYDNWATVNVSSTAYDATHPLPLGFPTGTPDGLAAGANSGPAGSNGPPAGLLVPAISKPVQLQVFPALGRTSVYAGACGDADYNEALNTNPTTTGSTQTVTVKTAAYNITARKQNANGVGTGNTLKSMIVYAKHASDATCPNGETYQIPGLTDAQGNISVSLPYGAWSFYVAGSQNAPTATNTVTGTPTAPVQSIIIAG